MNLKNILLGLLSNVFIRHYKLWLCVLLFIATYVIGIVFFPITLVLFVYLCIKTKQLAYQEMPVDIESGICLKNVWKCYLVRTWAMVRYIMFTGILLLLVCTIKNLQLPSWISSDEGVYGITLAFVYRSFMMDFSWILQVHGLFLAWVLITPIRPVISKFDDAYLIMEWYPVVNLFGKRDITLHLRDSFRSIGSKKNRIFTELEYSIEAVANSGFDTLTVNTHVGSERMWEVIRSRLASKSCVESIEIERKKKSGIMYVTFIASIYLKMIVLHGKSYSEYRKLLENQNLANNHICVFRFHNRTVCDSNLNG